MKTPQRECCEKCVGGFTSSAFRTPRVPITRVCLNPSCPCHLPPKEEKKECGCSRVFERPHKHEEGCEKFVGCHCDVSSPTSSASPFFDFLREFYELDVTYSNGYTNKLIEELDPSQSKIIKEFLQKLHLHSLELGKQLGAKEVEDKYNELIMAVARKFEGETRHETALRYIRQAEDIKSDEAMNC